MTTRFPTTRRRCPSACRLDGWHLGVWAQAAQTERCPPPRSARCMRWRWLRCLMGAVAGLGGAPAPQEGGLALPGGRRARVARPMLVLAHQQQRRLPLRGRPHRATGRRYLMRALLALQSGWCRSLRTFKIGRRVVRGWHERVAAWPLEADHLMVDRGWRCAGGFLALCVGTLAMRTVRGAEQDCGGFTTTC